MKHKIVIGLIAAFSLALAGTASAAITASTSVKVKANIGVKASSSLEKKVEGLEKKEEERGEKIEKRVEKLEMVISKTFTNFLTHLQKISTRLSILIDKMTANGRDTTEAKAKLDAANAKITLAVDAVTDFSAYANKASTTATTTKAYKEGFRAKRKTARTALVAVEKALNDVIVSLKKNNNDKINASSSAKVKATTTVKIDDDSNN